MRNVIGIIIVIAHMCFPTHKAEIFTNPVQSDGFGSQFQSIIAAVIYADLHHKPFVYTPFEKMEHNYDKDPQFIAKKEQLINFIGNFTQVHELNRQHYHIISHINYKAFMDAHPAECAQSSALKKLKNIFRANKSKDNYFDRQHTHIVIHIRRHNAHDNRISGTDTPDTHFLHIIEKLRNRYATKNPLFHIHSQGEASQFALFESPDVMIHLNDSVEETFTAMVLADALVTSPSSFSYAAALLSEGDVYYTPFWHKALPHWISVEHL